jgi:hypothetical protein
MIMISTRKADVRVITNTTAIPVYKITKIKCPLVFEYIY